MTTETERNPDGTGK